MVMDAQVERMKIELETETSRRRHLNRDYEHVSRWMTLVASGRTTWQPVRRIPARHIFVVRGESLSMSTIEFVSAHAGDATADA